MTHPTDAAIAQAFREFVANGYNEIFPCEIEDRARELDAEKGGDFCEMDWTPINSNQKKWTCRNCGESVVRNASDGHPVFRCKPTPPAQAAEAVSLETLLADMERTSPYQDVSGSAVLGWAQGIRAAIAAMQAGE